MNRNEQNRGRSRPSGRARSARELALDVLTRVDAEGAYSNLLLNEALRREPLPRQDASLATELVYGTIQRMNTIDHILSAFLAKGSGKLEPWVRNLLRLSVYQLRYLDRIPAHAAVNEAVNIAARRGHKGISGMVNAVLRNAIRQGLRLHIPADWPLVRRIALEHSHPEWLVARWIEQFGEAETRALCEANNRSPHTSIRVNALKTDPDALIALLAEQGIAARRSALSGAGLVVEGGGNMADTPWYEQGLFSIQDESSMLVAETVDPRPGMEVLDCCAAPGGKTTHMAELMGDRGTIYAFDLHPHKIGLIERQARRLGLGCITAAVGDAARLSEQFAEARFDRILVDAPCSGFGVLRRKPDLKWKRSEADIRAVSELQFRILSDVRRLLKPGGRLVYSTCTVEREENEAVIDRFLAAFPEFALERARRIMPHHDHADGFFIARLYKRQA